MVAMPHFFSDNFLTEEPDFWDLEGMEHGSIPLIPLRVTRITSRTRKTIPTHIVMFIRKASRIVVFMAVCAAKGLVIVWRGMAFAALVPFTLVFSAENGKKRLVVLRKVAGTPTGLCGMADFTIG
jgi:hypothetical protein